MSTSTTEEEKRLGKVYEILESAMNKDKFELPDNITVQELKSYVEDMITAAQPRYIRTDGRPSVHLKDYKIPDNYLVVGGNTVAYHHSMGPVFLTVPTDDDQEEQEVDSEEPKTNFTTIIPEGFVEHDFGKYIIYHIFKNGRKTLDELIQEITGIDKRLIVLMVNGLLNDGYLQKYVEKDDSLCTYELVTTTTLEPQQKLQ